MGQKESLRTSGVEELDHFTIVRACNKGDQAAVSAVITHHAPQIHNLVARMLVGRGDLINDVVQDVLVKVIGALPRFDPHGPAKLSTWMLTIATRTCIDVLRKPRRAAPLDFDPPAAHDPHRSTEHRDLYQKVAKAMYELPSEQRAALVLRAYHDCDTQEIATMLGVEPGTVKSRLSRARSALRRITADEQEVP